MDMSTVIIPKSDQWNADDFIAGPLTFRIRDVAIKGGQEQPVSIALEGTPKAFRPCKSMSRVLVQGWGADAKLYIGRSLTLYRDPKVKWGGMEVGGIRISHMSDIDRGFSMPLTATKGVKVIHSVKVLKVDQEAAVEQTPAKPASPGRTPEQMVEAFVAKVNECGDRDALADLQTGSQNFLNRMRQQHPDLHRQAIAAIVTRAAEIDADPPRQNEDHGDGFDGTEDAFGLKPIGAA